jgi:predicted nucleic acid-binding protein
VIWLFYPLGHGEAEAITVSVETGTDYLIIDDGMARRRAKKNVVKRDRHPKDSPNDV